MFEVYIACFTGETKIDPGVFDHKPLEGRVGTVTVVTLPRTKHSSFWPDWVLQTKHPSRICVQPNKNVSWLAWQVKNLFSHPNQQTAGESLTMLYRCMCVYIGRRCNFRSCALITNPLRTTVLKRMVNIACGVYGANVGSRSIPMLTWLPQDAATSARPEVYG